MASKVCDQCFEESRSHPQVDLPNDVPYLGAFYLYMTTCCNLRCQHCWITPVYRADDIPESERISIDRLEKAIDQGKPLGLNHIKLTGGEPTLHPNFREIAKMIADKGLSADMESNGTLINQELADYIHQETSIRFISISIDSFSEKKHDHFRGVKGSFRCAVDGLKNLVKVGYKPQVIMSLHRGNLKEVADLVGFACSLGAGSVKFNPVMSSGRGRDLNKKGLTLSLKETLAFAEYLQDELQPKNDISLILRLPPALKRINQFFKGGSQGCRVLNIIGILGSGEYALCGIGRNVPELCFGLVGKDDLRDLWINHPVLNSLRQSIKIEYPGICKDCIHTGGCLTQCVAQNYLDFGQLIHPSALCHEAEKEGLFPKTRRRSVTGFDVS